MKSQAKTVAEYFAELPAARRAALSPLRDLIRSELPDATEAMAHGMPVWKRNGALVCALASQKNHFAFYACNDAILAPLKPRLTGLDFGKSCIRFKRPEQLPLDVVREILMLLRAE